MDNLIENEVVDDKVTALSRLIKAEDSDAKKDSDQQSLFSETDDDDKKKDEKKDDYDEKYMKKYMKRYMKEQDSGCKKATDDLGDLHKAVDNEDPDIESVDEADATLINGTGFFKAQQDFNSGLLKALTGLEKKIDDLSGQIDYNTDIAKASGELMIKAREITNEIAATATQIASTPLPTKGGLVGAQQINKAINITEIKKKLLKAFTDGDEVAGQVLGRFESAGCKMALLPAANQKFIENLK